MEFNYSHALPNDRMKNLIKIKDLFEKEENEVSPNDYIKVKVRLASKVVTLPPRSRDGRPRHCCRFVFADDTDTIRAFLYFNDYENFNYNDKNILDMLKLYEVFKITGFKLQNCGSSGSNDSDDDDSPPPSLPGPVSINQPKRLILSHSTMNIVPVVDQQQFPFEFVKLEDIDCVRIGRDVDVIGVVDRVTEVKHSKGYDYQWIFLSSTLHPEMGFTRKICLFDDHINSVCENGVTGAIYAFSRLRVAHFEGNISLKTTDDTIIQEVTDNNFTEYIPLKFRDATFVTDLFPSRNPYFIYQQKNLALRAASTHTASSLLTPPRPHSPANSTATTLVYDEAQACFPTPGESPRNNGDEPSPSGSSRGRSGGTASAGAGVKRLRF